MTLLAVADARARILDGVTPLGVEDVALKDAAGRVLALDVAARLTQPPFDASAMDGYAVCAGDVAQHGSALDVIGQSQAGKRFRGRVSPGQAVRIFTGAPMPEGADTIVIQENTRAEAGRVIITEPAARGANIRPKGQDFLKGATLISEPAVLSSRLLTLAAAGGHGQLSVRRKPRIAILATGDELVLPGTMPGPDGIVACNAIGLSAMVTAAGGEPIDLGIARDTAEDLGHKIDLAGDVDVLVTIGGASVGDHDLVKPVLQSKGMTLDFWKIAMRPGKPLLFGKLGPMRVLGLPGNPVSCLITAMVFLVPLIRALLGLGDDTHLHRATLAHDLPANGPRDHYMRARLDTTTIPPSVSALPSQDSALISAFSIADVLIVQPAYGPAMTRGSEVDILHLDF